MKKPLPTERGYVRTKPKKKKVKDVTDYPKKNKKGNKKA